MDYVFIFEIKNLKELAYSKILPTRSYPSNSKKELL